MVDAERVRRLLAEKGLSQADLARLVGATPPAIQQILSGKTKRSRLIGPIAQILGASEAYILGTSDTPFDDVSGTMRPEELARQLRVRLSGTQVRGTLDDESRSTPFMNDIFDPSWLLSQISEFDPTILDVTDEDFVPPVRTILATTDAMSPTINKNDQVTVSLWTTEVSQPDGIWLLSYGGLRMIRRLMPLPGGGYRVSADNPNSPTFEAPEKDIQIFGRAFWLGRGLA